jgi:hypothetical protein
VSKLNQREKILAAVTGGIVFLLLNLLLVNAFIRKNIVLRADLAQGQSNLAAMKQLLAEQDLWVKRNDWITKKQPKLSNEGAAGVELLDFIRTVGKRTNITIDNPAIGAPAKTQWARSVSVTLDTHSSWADLIQFLQSTQQPDQFIVFEDAHIQIDAGDATKMQGHFKIARWYAL